MAKSTAIGRIRILLYDMPSGISLERAGFLLPWRTNVHFRNHPARRRAGPHGVSAGQQHGPSGGDPAALRMARSRFGVRHRAARGNAGSGADLFLPRLGPYPREWFRTGSHFGPRSGTAPQPDAAVAADPGDHPRRDRRPGASKAGGHDTAYAPD